MSSDEEVNAKRAACELAKGLVRLEELAHDTLARRASLRAATTAQEANVRVPPTMAFGIRARE